MISEVKVSKSLEHFSDQNEFLNEMVKESHSESAVTNAQRACEVSGLNVVCISVSETAQAEWGRVQSLSQREWTVKQSNKNHSML